MRVSALLAAIGLVFGSAIGTASAGTVTISNEGSWDGSLDNLDPQFGSLSKAQSEGESFVAQGSTLESVSFLIATGPTLTGKAALVVASFDSLGMPSTALYRSQEFTLDPTLGYTWNTVSGINLAVTPGQSYLAFLTTIGVSGSPPQNALFALTQIGGPFNPMFWADNASLKTDPLDPSLTWTMGGSGNVADVVRIQFQTAVTPIPSTALLFASSLAPLFCFARRRKGAA